jgi:hypothetical protein
VLIAERMEQRYGKSDFKVVVLREKIKELRTATSAIKKEFTSYLKKTNDAEYFSYRDLNKQAGRQLEHNVNALRRIGLMPDKLSEHRWFSFINQILNYLKIKPSSYKEYSIVLHTSEEQVAELSKPVLELNNKP